VGVLGFSAGGALAGALSTHYQTRLYPHIDAADTRSARPDFTLMVYPAPLTGALGMLAAHSGVPVSLPAVCVLWASLSPSAARSHSTTHICCCCCPLLLLGARLCLLSRTAGDLQLAADLLPGSRSSGNALPGLLPGFVLDRATPPAFVAQAADDEVGMGPTPQPLPRSPLQPLPLLPPASPSQPRSSLLPCQFSPNNALAWWAAATAAHKGGSLPACELTLFSSGGHGFGVCTDPLREVCSWTGRAAGWLRAMGVIGLL
jgi:hypothetical protein